MLVRRTNSLLDSLLNEDWFAPLSLKGASTPSMDVHTTDKEIVVEAELPGVDLKDVDISIDHNILTIRGEKVHETEKKDKEYIRLERYQGSFSRSFTLPSSADSSRVDASYDKGVLKITIPKKEEVQPRRIPIKVK